MMNEIQPEKELCLGKNCPALMSRKELAEPIQRTALPQWNKFFMDKQTECSNVDGCLVVIELEQIREDRLAAIKKEVLELGFDPDNHRMSY